MVLLDTCALVELCKPAKDQAITLKTRREIDKGAFILSISFAELACKIKAKKLDLGLSVEAFYQLFLSCANAKIIDIGVPEWFDSIEMNWPQNQDPADRLITAYAAKHALSIVTTDKKIKAYYHKVLW